MNKVKASASQPWQLSLALISTLLGVSGYLLGNDIAAAGSTANAAQTILDALFFTFKLFAGAAPATIPHDHPIAAICLNIARFTAPASLILAFLARFEGLWKPMFVRCKLRRLKGFDIHYGRGDVSAMMAYQNNLEGRWTIIVDTSHGDAPASYALEPATRQIKLNEAALRATIRRTPMVANTLVFAADDDLANIRAATRLDRTGLKHETEFAHIGDENLRLDTVAAGGFVQSSASKRVQVFSKNELTARAFFRNRDIFWEASAAELSVIHIALVGFSDDVMAFFYHAIKVSPHPSFSPIKFTIFTPRARAVESLIKTRIGPLDGIVDLNVIEIADGNSLANLPDEVSSLPNMWYISEGWLNGAYGKVVGLSAALAQRGNAGSVIYLPFTRSAMETVESLPNNPVIKVRCISDNFRALSYETFANEMDKLARKIHEAYQSYKISTASEGKESLEQWFALEENFKAANRRAADAIKTKLEALGQAGPLASVLENGIDLGDISPALREKIAIAEHKSWLADRVISGWRYGEVRDNDRRLHPNLVDFDALSDADKNLDRQQLDFVLSLLQKTSP